MIPLMLKDFIDRKLENFEERRINGDIDFISFYSCVSFITSMEEFQYLALNKQEIAVRNTLFYFIYLQSSRMIRQMPKPEYNEEEKIKEWKRKLRNRLQELQRPYIAELMKLMQIDKKKIIHVYQRQTKDIGQEIMRPRDAGLHIIGDFKWMGLRKKN